MPATSVSLDGAAILMPTFPAGEATVPVIPVAKITLPRFIKLLVEASGVSTLADVPSRITLLPVAKVVEPTCWAKDGAVRGRGQGLRSEITAREDAGAGTCSRSVSYGPHAAFWWAVSAAWPEFIPPKAF